MKKGIKKRVARIKASGKATGKEAKQLARKRAKSYASGGSSSKKVGPGKKGSLKREVYKGGGSKSDLEALRQQTKTTRKAIKQSSQSNKNYDIKGTAKNMKRANRTKADRGAEKAKAKADPYTPKPRSQPSAARREYDAKVARRSRGSELGDIVKSSAGM